MKKKGIIIAAVISFSALVFAIVGFILLNVFGVIDVIDFDFLSTSSETSGKDDNSKKSSGGWSSIRANIALETACSSIDANGNYDSYISDEDENNSGIKCENFLCTVKYNGKIYTKECVNEKEENKVEDEFVNLVDKVKVTYETDEELNNDETMGEHYVNIKIYNVNSRFRIKINISGDGLNSSVLDVGYENIGKDGTITLRQKASDKNVNYSFEIYSIVESDYGKILRNMELIVPHFNPYSELDVCKDIPDYYLCVPYTISEIDGANFYENVEKYKESLNR